MRLSFLGSAGEVTGSCTLVETADARFLVDGARSVRIFNDDIAVRAQLHTIGGLSAHADRDGLLAWLCRFAHAPERTFMVHGERETSVGFAAAVNSELGWTRGEAPQRGEAHTIT